jgi:hypothetical protein
LYCAFPQKLCLLLATVVCVHDNNGPGFDLSTGICLSKEGPMQRHVMDGRRSRATVARRALATSAPPHYCTVKDHVLHALDGSLPIILDAGF